MINVRLLPLFIGTLIFSGVAAAAPAARPTAPYGTQSMKAEYEQRMREMNAGLGFDLAAPGPAAPSVRADAIYPARLISIEITHTPPARAEYTPEWRRAQCGDDDNRRAEGDSGHPGGRFA